MSESTDVTPSRRDSRAAIDPALLRIAAQLAPTLGLSREAWLDSRLRAALLADLHAADCDRVEPYALMLLHWAAGNRCLDPAALPASAELADAFGVALPGRTRGRGRKRAALSQSHALYEADALATAAERIGDDEHKKHFRALQASGATRTLPTVDRRQERRMAALLAAAPHLREATEAVLGGLAIARRAGAPLQLTPLLLSGPPAAGKTWWARRAADALGLPCARIAMPKVTASFALSGGTPSWSNSRPGRIVQEFMRTDGATPIFILDEIDKISAGNYDPAPVLLDLLERDSAKRWHDEFFDIEFDVSRAIVIATANRPQDMDPALRSRFREIVVDRPGRRELPAVIQSAWSEHRDRYPGLALPKTLPAEALESLVADFSTIRALQRRFDDAIARAARRPGRLRLQPGDLDGANPLRLVRRA